VFCKLTNSFEDYQSYYFSTCDGRQISCRGNAEEIQTVYNMAVQISESKLNTLSRNRFPAKVAKRKVDQSVFIAVEIFGLVLSMTAFKHSNGQLAFSSR